LQKLKRESSRLPKRKVEELYSSEAYRREKKSRLVWEKKATLPSKDLGAGRFAAGFLSAGPEEEQRSDASTLRRKSAPLRTLSQGKGPRHQGGDCFPRGATLLAGKKKPLPTSPSKVTPANKRKNHTKKCKILDQRRRGILKNQVQKK